jgi:hypothetical protein
MVAAAVTGGGALLVDGNLQGAYSSLAWLRQALQVMASDPTYGGISSHGSDPVMSVLQELDWDKTSVEDTIASLGKAGSGIGEVVDDLKALLNKADTAWYGEVYSLFRIIVSNIKDDCTSVGHALEQTRTDVDGHKKGWLGDLGLKQTVFEGMDELTGDVRKFAEGLGTQYAYEADLACSGDVQAQDDMQTAFNALVQEVHDTVPRITSLQSGPKGHTAPLKFKSN